MYKKMYIPSFIINSSENEMSFKEMKMTSAYANKLIKKLKEDRDYWREIEKYRHKYVVAQGEEPIVPEYDFLEVHKAIADIDEKIIKIKHALNVTNSTNSVEVEGKIYTIDIPISLKRVVCVRDYC